MSDDSSARERRAAAATVACVVTTAAVAFTGYSLTAARTITWWDGSSYPLAAATLGIPGAPGSLLLTLLGWVVCQVPIVAPVAFRLNLFAALMGATLVGLISWLAIRLAASEDREPQWPERFGGVLAGGTFAFAATPWTYAVQFTPYVLSALFTALILLAALAWWRRPEGDSGSPHLFLLFLLFGLDFSVHRTNALLLPAALLWLAMRHPRGPGRPGEWAAALAGMALGLSFHLLLIPMALRQPSYMVEAPVDLASWWSYVAVEAKGGGFLIRVFPRAAHFLGVQLQDYLAFLERNLSGAFYLAAVLAACGWLAILRTHPRRALGWLVFFLSAGLGAVIYFNLPQNYMRSIDRHYLPSLVILAPWIGVGAAALVRLVTRAPAGRWLAPAVGLALTLAPLAAWRANRFDCDLSRVRFTEDYARNLLEPLPPDAVLLTNGDNDTLPLWYMQWVEGVRTDVTVINLPCLNIAEYVASLRRKHPDLSGMLEGEPDRGVLKPRLAATSVTTVVEPRTGLGLPAGVVPPDSVTFRLQGESYAEDRAVLDILRLTRWRRPMLLATTVSRERLRWIWPYVRLAGMSQRVVPSTDPTVWDLEYMREQLLERTRYTGLADSTIPMDRDTRWLGSNYAAALFQLAAGQLGHGQPREALATLAFLDRHVPLERFGGPGAELRAHMAGFRAQVELAAAGLQAR